MQHTKSCRCTSNQLLSDNLKTVTKEQFTAFTSAFRLYPILLSTFNHNSTIFLFLLLLLFVRIIIYILFFFSLSSFLFSLYCLDKSDSFRRRYVLKGLCSLIACLCRWFDGKGQAEKLENKKKIKLYTEKERKKKLKIKNMHFDIRASSLRIYIFFLFFPMCSHHIHKIM